MKYKMLAFNMALAVLLSLILTSCQSTFWPELREKETEQMIQEEPEQAVPFEDIQRGETNFFVPEGMRVHTVYFAVAGGSYLVPINLAIPQTEGIARATLEKLIAGPSPGWEMRYGLQAVLPSATQVLGLTIREGLARVDLSQEVLAYEPEKERMMIDALVYTLTQFSTVDHVALMVEGEFLTELPGGTPGGEHWGRERGINLEVKDSVEDFTAATRLTLYFCLPAGEKIFYLPVTRVVPAVNEEELARVALQELLAGPRRGSGLFSDLPPELGAKEITRDEQGLVVNFNSALSAYRGGVAGAENMLNQIILTLTELPGVEKVQLLVEGEQVVLPDSISLLSFQSRPEYYNFLE